MTRPHIRVPSALQYSGLPAGPRDLWALLDDLCREHTGVRATVSQLASTSHCSADTIKRRRAALVKAGWLSWEPARHRGEATLWTPLQRARDARHAGAVPVDNRPGRGAGRGAGLHPSDQQKGCRPARLDAAATRARTEEEEAHDDVPSWCGACEAPDYRWRESPAVPGAYERCPACHPDAVPAF